MMPQILIIDGATGAGKSTVLDFLKRRSGIQCVIAKKFTTRTRRPTDNDWEFSFVPSINIEANPYWFESLGNRYAIDASQLASAIETKALFVTSAVDRKFMDDLKRDYNVHVMYLFRSWTKEAFDNLIVSRGGLVGSPDYQRRWAEVQTAVSDYAKKLSIYDSVIINSSDLGLLIRQVEAVIESWR